MNWSNEWPMRASSESRPMIKNESQNSIERLKSGLESVLLNQNKKRSVVTG